jgi:methionine-rich copper-binding protein CopC
MRKFIVFMLSIIILLILTACGSSPTLPPITDPEPEPSPTDTNAPTILLTKPSSNATDIATNTSLSITFSEAMDESSVSFSLSPDVPMQAPSWNADKTRVTFVPQSALSTATTYTATILGKDKVGNELSGGNRFSFTTGNDADNAPPILVQSTPANNATDVATNSTIALFFNEPMATDSVTLTLDPAVSFEAPIWNDSRTLAVFTPSSVLAANTTFTATVAGNDLADNVLTGSSSFSFSTAVAADTTAPTVISTNPANNATNMVSNSTITLTFSEAMNQASVEGAFSTNPSISCSWSWNAASTVATCTPNTLAPDTQYNMNLGSSAEDNAGNSLTQAYSFSFRTSSAPDTTAPMVVDTTPDSDEIGVKRDGSITLFFSEAMDTTATGNAITVQGSSWNDGFDLGWGSDKKGVTLIPHSEFPYGENIVVTVGTGAKDEAGNALAQAYVFEFRVIRRTTTTLTPVASLSGQAVAGGYLVADNGFAGEITNDSIRTMLTFDLSGLPADLTSITSAFLYLRETSVTGNPYGELGDLQAHHVNYGASLDANDFNTSTLTICNQNLCIPDPHSVVMTLNLAGRSATDTDKVQSDWNKRSERGNRSQYLIRFAQDRNEDGTLDQVRFNLPQSYLSVTYEHP